MQDESDHQLCLENDQEAANHQESALANQKRAIGSQSFTNEFAHPYAPDAKWSFSISRPFRIASVDKLTNEIILPILAERGVILECHDASVDPQSKDFWMNRMKVILELADFQIFVEMNPTPQVEFEAVYSKAASQTGMAPALAVNFGMKRRKAGIFKPIVISIKHGSGRDRFSVRRRHAIFYWTPQGNTDQDCKRFMEILDRCIKARIRTIEWWDAAEKKWKKRAEMLKPKVENLTMRILEHKAKQDPQWLQQFGGNMDAARERLRKEMVSPTIPRSRPRLEVRKTLINQAALAEIVSRNPSALDAFGAARQEGKKIAAENEIETYLHTIRRGEAEFHQTFSETYRQERSKLQREFDNRLGRIFEQITVQSGNSTDESNSTAQLSGFFSKLLSLSGWLGALRFRSRVRQAKGEFYRTGSSNSR